MEIKETKEALWWTNQANIDGDGCPRCYGPKGTKPLDYLGNAGEPGDWYGIVTDTKGNPVVQGPNDPYPGYYISPTSLGDKSKKATDPTKYVDAEKVPYIAVAKNLIKNNGVALGDVGIVYCTRTGKQCSVIAADVGPKNKYGEISIACANTLGIPSSPKNGGEPKGVLIIIFKGSSKGWPRTNEDIDNQARDLLCKAGGLEKFK